MTPIVPLGAGFRLPPLMSESADLRALFHRLNNQLGTILAHAELLESKAAADPERVRAAQIVASALEAMTTVRAIREQAVDGPAES
jgi:signal transduction histidine kinase